MNFKIFLKAKLIILLLCIFPSVCNANEVDTKDVFDLSEPIQTAVDCLNYMLANDYNSYFQTLHPQLIERSGGEGQVEESFDTLVSQLDGAIIELNMAGTKKRNKRNSTRYYVQFEMDMQGSKGSNTVVVSKTPDGWKVIDI